MKPTNLILMLLMTTTAVCLCAGCGGDKPATPVTIKQDNREIQVPEDPGTWQLIPLLSGSEAEAMTGADEIAKIGPGARAAIPALIKLVRANKNMASGSACRALYSIGSAAIPSLRDTMNDSNPEVRERIYRTLGWFGPKAIAALPELKQALDKETGKTRQSLMVALCQIEPANTASVVPELMENVRSKSTEIRNDAIWSLGDIGPPAAAAAVPLLAELYESKEDVNRSILISALGKMGEAAVPTLVIILESNNENRDYRNNAAEALGEIGPPASASIEPLRKALTDKSSGLRKAASAALLKIDRAGNENALLAHNLKELEQNDPERLKEAMAGLKLQGPKAAPAVPALLRIMSSARGETREEAVITLGEIGPEAKAAVPALIEALKDMETEPYIRKQMGSVAGLRLTTYRATVARSLGKIGPAARDAIEPLDNLRQHDKDIFLRGEAAEALRMIKQ